MLGIILVIIGFCVWAALGKWSASREHLIEPRARLPLRGIQIICGNCGGNSLSPKKTYLDRFGRCEQCGGDSLMLAADLGSRERRLRIVQLRTNESTTAKSWQRPFVKKPQLHSPGVEKMSA